MFYNPPIAVHNNFALCSLELDCLPANVFLVEPWMPTRWGTFSVVEANLAALRLLYQVADPDWVIYLSGADYPIKSAPQMLADLAKTEADVWLDHRQITNIKLPSSHQRNLALAFDDAAWIKLAYDRYVGLGVVPYTWTRKVAPGSKPVRIRGALANRLSPFGPAFRPYGGECWYTIKRSAAQILLNPDEAARRLQRHYIRRSAPEESYFHTILCNSNTMIIDKNNRRYTDWSQGGPSPKLLDSGDLKLLIASDAHFARKFSTNHVVLDELDAKILAK